MASPLWILDKWLIVISNPNFNVVQSLQDKFQNLLDQNFEIEHSRKLLSAGEQEIIEQLFSTGHISSGFVDGSTFEAKLLDANSHNGVCKASLTWTVDKLGIVLKLEGFFHQNNLIGNVARTFIKDGMKQWTEVFYCKKGVMHGFYRKFNNNNQLLGFGLYINGTKDGPWWRWMLGGGYLVTFHSQTGEAESAFLFPDCVTSLVGHFSSVDPETTSQHSNIQTAFNNDDIVMKKAVLRFVKTLKLSKFGVLSLEFEDWKGADEIFVRENEDATYICQNHLQPDPYETRHVMVRDSLIPGAGEGLFAKCDFETGKVVAYFHGVKRNISDPEQSCPKSSDYSISCSEPNQTEMKILDIPEPCRRTDVYCATLAHKICHSFAPNSNYSVAFHPRFGFIRCAVSLRKILAGEEITCDYKYSLSKAPEWYLLCLKDHLTKV